MIHPLLVARSDYADLALLPARGNRYSLIGRATGTGKTVTLQRLAEPFPLIGTPIFMADAKNGLSGDQRR